jgi:hypothetical protein
MFPCICFDMGRQTKSHHGTCQRTLANALAPPLCSLSEPRKVRCERGEETVQFPHCKVVSDLLRRFPDLLESQSSQPNHLSPSPLINHVAHLTGPNPRAPPAHRSNINPQSPQSSLCTRPRPPHSRCQTMVLPTSSSTTLETRSYFSIEVQLICAASYGYSYIRISALYVNQEGTGLVRG